MLFFKRKKDKTKDVQEAPSEASVPEAEGSAESELPKAGGERPKAGGEQPKAGGEQPKAEGEQPAAEVEQPTAEVEQPKAEPESANVESELHKTEPEQPSPEPKKPKLGVFARIKQGLARTSQQLSKGLAGLLLGKKTIDDELLEEIETQLLLADVGMEATEEIIESLTESVARKELADSEALFAKLKLLLQNMLTDVEAPLEINTQHSPYVLLVVGVNGVGKTTTIGKLAKRFQREGRSVMLAAGDTFRAAAVEQLEEWGRRNDVPVIAQHTGADSASVIYDAIQSAQSRNIDVIIADTAGRLHNKSNLMEELTKVKRVMGKLDNSAPHEVLLVLDAGTGQNAVTQAEQFKDAAGVTGLALTKLDGTAKGGVIFALSKKFKIPIRFIGVGEGIDDLQPFDAEKFTQALFDA